MKKQMRELQDHLVSLVAENEKLKLENQRLEHLCYEQQQELRQGQNFQFQSGTQVLSGPEGAQLHLKESFITRFFFHLVYRIAVITRNILQLKQALSYSSETSKRRLDPPII